MRYFMRIAIAFDQLANALIGGWPDETLSAYAHRMREKGQPYWGWTASAIDKLFFWQTGHCAAAHEAEVKRWQSPPSTRHPTQPAQAGFFTPEER